MAKISELLINVVMENERKLLFARAKRQETGLPCYG